MCPDIVDNVLIVGPRLSVPLNEIVFTFSRSGGPGGQNVNKVNSKAIMRWPIQTSTSIPDDVLARFQAKFGTRVTSEGDLIITSQRYRDQASNVDDCLQKLQDMLGEVLERPIMRRATKPTKSSQHQRVETKRENSLKKQHRRPVRSDDD